MMIDPTTPDTGEGQEPLEADPPDIDAGPPPEPEPEGKPLRHTRRPTNTAGWYMVLAAPTARGGYEEVGWYKASGDDQAKRHAVDDAKRGHLPELKQALATTGIYLRGVPARSWPKTERSGYDQPPPQLRIG